jgi:tRNA(adenine34) deaminase
MALKHIDFMKLALSEAKHAQIEKEIPIGAVLVDEKHDLLASAHNQSRQLNDPTAHAEIQAIRQAAAKIGNYRLLNTTLYVTVEPCPMCMGAIIHARISQVVFGTRDSKWGAVGSLYNFAEDHRFNHQPKIIAGICKEESKELMQRFFRQKRK